MINLKYFNNNKLKKIGSTVLVSALIGTSTFMFSGCGSKEVEDTINELIAESGGVEQQKEERGTYAVVVENDIAVIYGNVDDNTAIYTNNRTSSISLPFDAHILRGYSLSFVEEYAKMLISENGIIRYYNVDEKEKEKTLQKTMQ